MKKIALIYYHPLDSVDGATKVIKSYVDNNEILRDYGVTIDVYAPTQASGVNYSNEKPASSILRWVKEIVFKIDIAGVLRMSYNLYVRSRNAVKLYEHRPNNEEYDAVFVHDLLTCYSYLKNGDGKPVMLVMHTTGDLLSMPLTYFPLLKYTIFYNVILKGVVKTVLKNVNKIVFNSKLAADYFTSRYPNTRPGIASFVNNGIVDLPNKINLGDSALDHPYKIICVGSVSERKGQRFIVEALRRCSDDERSKVQFHIVGDGEIRAELEDICKSEDLQNNIIFYGLQRNVVPYLEKAQIFILPSVDEGMPISILEAMRQGLPVVSTNVGGIPYQVINRRTGLLIDASADGVLNFIKNIENYDWIKMGAASRRRYEEEFGIEQMMCKYAALLISICK